MPRESGFTDLTEAVDAVAAIDSLLASLTASRAVLTEAVREWVADRPEQFEAPEVEAEDLTGLAPELVEQLAAALRLPAGSAVALIEESRALVHEHPRTLAALRGGHISHAHAQTILGYTEGLRRGNRVALETRLLKRARTVTPGELSVVARVERDRRLRQGRPVDQQGPARRQRLTAYPTGLPMR